MLFGQLTILKHKIASFKVLISKELALFSPGCSTHAGGLWIKPNFLEDDKMHLTQVSRD